MSEKLDIYQEKEEKKSNFVCKFCDKPFEEHSIEDRYDSNNWIKEEKMDEEYCLTHGVIKSCGKCWKCEQGKSKPNPSPRDIFQHIGKHKAPEENWECKNAGERRAFDEFMPLFPCPWKTPLTDSQMIQIKEFHAGWYEWLVKQGLVQRKMVKKQAWANVYRYSDILGNYSFGPGISFPSEETAKCRHEKDGTYIKTILIHEWEEEQK